MKRVAIAAASDVAPGQHWARSLSQLVLDGAGALLERAPVDALFVAAPSALPAERQAGAANVLADRLCLPRGAVVQQHDLGDASGAAALHAAYAYVAAGLCRFAMVIAAAKISDLSENERWALLDGAIDREAEAALGLSYAALHGLTADLYLRRYGLDERTLAHVVAANAASAVRAGETFLKHAPSALEASRDLHVARPLRRSDFAQPFDGACMLLVCELGAAVELEQAPVEIRALGCGTDLSVLADRQDPLAFEAAAVAAGTALERARVSREALACCEIDNACSIHEVLALEAIGLAPAGKACALLAKQREQPDACAINPGGGALGRGHVYGASGLYQARELFLQLGPGAGARQVMAAQAPRAAGLALSIGGVGQQAHALVCSRVER